MLSLFGLLPAAAVWSQRNSNQYSAFRVCSEFGTCCPLFETAFLSEGLPQLTRVLTTCDASVQAVPGGKYTLLATGGIAGGIIVNQLLNAVVGVLPH